MKFIDEFRKADLVRDCAAAIAKITTKDWTIMEVCGGQTHSIVKYGLDHLLPSSISLIHGPGCPVCVTSTDVIDQAIAIAARPNVIFCSFGDMLRVPGSQTDLFTAKANGADIRTVYSPLDALKIAQQFPDRQVVFFGVGFETTVPATALTVARAAKLGLDNFSLLSAHVLVPPAMIALLAESQCRVQGFLAAGHVCTVMGFAAYEAIARQFHVPIVVTGFEPTDILQGIYHCIGQLEAGRSEVENKYSRSVRRDGNIPAISLIEEIFMVVDREWRGLGNIPQSGLSLRPKYELFEACRRFESILAVEPVTFTSPCLSGEILQGLRKPDQCPSFGIDCTPDRPLGAPMVSSEGACAAYYRYRVG